MLNTVIDALIDGCYTSTATILGYMAGQGGVINMPTKPVIMMAILTGLGGFLNQLRALRKQPR